MGGEGCVFHSGLTDVRPKLIYENGPLINYVWRKRERERARKEEKKKERIWGVWGGEWEIKRMKLQRG